MAKNTGVERFFDYARERHSVYLRRQVGQPRAEWTSDKILQRYRFTNVFRELDKTTVWFRERVRDKMRNDPRVLLATVVFRMLNRIETGEAVFQQTSLTDEGDLHTAFEKFMIEPHVGHLRHAIKLYCGRGPYVTGAYIISSPPGYKKLDGVLRILRGFATERCANKTCEKMDWLCCANRLITHPSEHTLRQTHEWLSTFPYLGNFHSYEIVTDLRHTALLDHAPDIDTWASPGPGCRRGLNHAMGREPKSSFPVDQMLVEMKTVLGMSRDPKYWPQPHGDVLRSENEIFLGGHGSPAAQWPRWEMREVEHTFCEFWKYERFRLTGRRPRGVFR